MHQESLRSFDRDNTPRRALAQWDAVAESLEPVRESANFVYRFRDTAGRLRYLRMGDHRHRTISEIEAELEFVNHLADQGALVARPVPSKAGALLETIGTDHGDIHAVVFEEAVGEVVKWGTDAQNRKYLFERGQSLGRLHRASQSFRPTRIRRAHWYEDDLFTNPTKYLPEHETVARGEYQDLIKWMLARPRTPDNYGMVHGDFGTFNTLRRPDGRLVAIDFDDCNYHWFLYDVAVSIRSARKLPDKYRKPYLKVLLEGYATEMPLNGEGAAEVARFSRLAALYRNPPAWY
jgi:Ser/Thr protein kinase RdoA (MazF antagonist)